MLRIYIYDISNLRVKERALDVGGPVRYAVPSPTLLRIIREQSMSEETELIFVPIFVTFREF